MVKWFVILTFEFVGKSYDTNISEKWWNLFGRTFACAFLFLGILKIWDFLVNFHLPSVSSDYLGVNGGGM